MSTLDVNVVAWSGIAGAAIAVAALLTAIVAGSSMRRWRTRCAALESNFAELRRELELVASISMRTRGRVERIEHEYSGIADRVELVESRGVAGCFDQAIDSARRGADPNTLTQQFGLSRSEADLVTRLHGRQKLA
jgi:hypothetical protein